MRKYHRMPQAPSEPPPQLAEFLSHFHVHFAQQRSRATLARYLSGLLTAHPTKNCATLAAVVQGTREQPLPHLLTEMVWDEVDLNRQRVRVRRGLRPERDGGLRSLMIGALPNRGATPSAWPGSLRARWVKWATAR